MNKNCDSENYCYDENSSHAGSHRCRNDCMCDGKRKCFIQNVNNPGICTGNPVTGKYSGAPSFSVSPVGHMWNAIEPLALYLPPNLTSQEKEQLKCVWNRH